MKHGTPEKRSSGKLKQTVRKKRNLYDHDYKMGITCKTKTNQHAITYVLLSLLVVQGFRFSLTTLRCITITLITYVITTSYVQQWFIITQP